MHRLALVVFLSRALSAQFAPLDLINHNRPIVDAHNCYPYEGQWSDRIERALKLGFPVGIEQDLAWAVDGSTGKGRIVVSHQKATRGDEPTLRQHFFERVRPIIEKALKANDSKTWPIIVVHFDFKDNRPELLHAVWDLLGEYEGWITTASVTADPHELAPYAVKPLLVMTEESDAQEDVFFKPLKNGRKATSVRLRPHRPPAARRQPPGTRPPAGDAAARTTAGGKAHQLPPLVEQFLVRSRGRRPAQRGRLDCGRRPPPAGTRRPRSQDGVLDSLLHPRWVCE